MQDSVFLLETCSILRHALVSSSPHGSGAQTPNFTLNRKRAIIAVDFKDIKRIVELMEQYGLSAFTLEQDQTKLELKRGGDFDIKAIQSLLASSHPPQYAMPYPVAPSVPSASTSVVTSAKEEVLPSANLKEITSPMVGTFYSASSPDSPVFVKIGSKISVDSTVCIIEAMKVMNEIKADIAGEIVEILVENGSAVQYGEVLYRVKVG